MNKILMFLTFLILASCANGNNPLRGPRGNNGTPGTVVTTPVVQPSTEQEEVNSLVADENSYREGLGQTELSNGLSCTLYTITGGSYILNNATHTPTLTGITQVATFLQLSSFNQANTSVSAGLNVLPPALMNNPTYQNLIKLQCKGQVVVTSDGWYLFDLTSDDGSLLYIADNGQGVNNTLVIDNDGNHGATDKSGSKYLRSGVHSFELDFAQTGAGNQALILNVNGQLLDPMYMFH